MSLSGLSSLFISISTSFYFLSVNIHNEVYIVKGKIKLFFEAGYIKKCAEQRDYLVKLKKNGQLIHTGKNILVTTHVVLRRLVKQNFLEQIKENGSDPVYKLKHTEKGLLD